MSAGANQKDLVVDLVEKIEALNPNDRRLLRVAAGRGITANSPSESILRRLLPDSIAPEDEPRYLYAITLCAACKAGKEGKGSFGMSLGTADRKEAAGQFSDYLASLLDLEDLHLLAAQVAHGIKYLNATRSGLDRHRLMRDFLGWNDGDLRVRQTWAKEYARASARAADKPDDVVRGFFAALRAFTSEQREAFEACSSIPLQSATGTTLIAFYTALPEKVYPADEELYFQAAILSSLNVEYCGPQKNLGASLRSACTPENESYLSNSLKELVESDRGQLYPLLLELVIYLGKLKVDFCPEQLLNDLLFWDHPARSIQSGWLNSFFGS